MPDDLPEGEDLGLIAQTGLTPTEMAALAVFCVSLAVIVSAVVVLQYQTNHGAPVPDLVVEPPSEISGVPVRKGVNP